MHRGGGRERVELDEDGGPLHLDGPGALLNLLFSLVLAGATVFLWVSTRAAVYGPTRASDERSLIDFHHGLL